MRDEYLVDMAIKFEMMSRERSRQRRKSSVPDLGPPGTRMYTFQTTPCYAAPGTRDSVQSGACLLYTSDAADE